MAKSMSNTYLVNAFSINMLEVKNQEWQFHPLDLDQAREVYYIHEPINAIGHEDTSVIIGGLLGAELHANRQNVTLTTGDALLVAQYTGPRLPEGATKLPEGATIRFWFVR